MVRIDFNMILANINISPEIFLRYTKDNNSLNGLASQRAL
jgi:hypothetical protein